jgi:hypothetical protein
MHIAGRLLVLALSACLAMPSPGFAETSPTVSVPLPESPPLQHQWFLG